MNTTPEALQLLNFCEINRHTGLASDLRKAMGIDKPSGCFDDCSWYGYAYEKQIKANIISDVRADHAAAEGADYVAANWLWPEAPGTPGAFKWIDEEAMVAPQEDVLESMLREDEVYCRGGKWSWFYQWNKLPNHRFIWSNGEERKGGAK